MDRLHGATAFSIWPSASRLALLVLVLGLCAGCREREQFLPSPYEPQPALSLVPAGCRGCHPGVQPDSAHALACTACHGGQDNTLEVTAAHQGLKRHPASAVHAPAACGPCHAQQVAAAAMSSHYTLHNEINQIRKHFSLPAAAGPDDLLQEPAGSSLHAVVDDLMRRHCLRCHVHTPGDDYPATRHGLGCAACHLEVGNAQMPHRFLRHPGDRQCLACHRGGYVGGEYHGMAERDTTLEFRTPYAGPGADRDYGIELHRLTADVHQLAGMLCIDCHDGAHLMAAKDSVPPQVQCSTCHAWQPGQPLPPAPAGLRLADGTLVLQRRQHENPLPVPPLRHPIHFRTGDTVDCVVCHARWAAIDQPLHLLRRERGSFSFWAEQAVQGNSRLEQFLARAEAESTSRASSSDRFSGGEAPGIWLQGYGQRRWEKVVVRRDQAGRIRLYRPVLDLRLSVVDGSGHVAADNLRGADDGYRPWTPHTIGRAGSLYQYRLQADTVQDAEPGEAP